jgi:tetratricopeptide (TPR) repeat protein
MDRRGRRALIKRSGKILAARTTGLSPELGIEELHAAALLHRKKGELLAAQNVCRAILARDSRHVGALIIMGGTSQEQGRNSAAIKFLKEALALDERSARAHDNLALTYQALGRHDDAVTHFSRAIALGLGNVESVVKQSPAVSGPMSRLAMAWPRQLSLAEIFGPSSLRVIAEEGLLLALLQCRVVCDLELERFLTIVRAALLRALATGHREGWDDGLRFFRALALQCFINEYIYSLSDIERDQSERRRERLIQKFNAHAEITPLDLMAVAMYRPLHTLPMAATLLDRRWPEIMEPLLTQQIREPLEEASDRDAIPTLTATEDSGSLENEKQYDENPYPRWFARPAARPVTLDDYLRDKLGHLPDRARRQ